MTTPNPLTANGYHLIAEQPVAFHDGAGLNVYYVVHRDGNAKYALVRSDGTYATFDCHELVTGLGLNPHVADELLRQLVEFEDACDENGIPEVYA